MNEMTKDLWITTEDNPYNPFTQFQHWLSWDQSHGYDTCGRLDRFAGTSDNLTEVENNYRMDRAIADLGEQELALGVIGGELRYVSAYKIVTPKDCVNF